MAQEDHSLLKEIQEDIRRERLIKRGYRYAPYGFVGIVMILAGTLGWILWQDWQQRRDEAQTTHLISALTLMETENPQAAARSLSEGLEWLGSPKETFSRLLEATIRVRANDPTGAVQTLEPVLDDQVYEPYRSLALFLSILYEIDVQDPAVLERRLLPLLEDDHPWRHHALELQAILAHRQNDTERALDLLSQVQDEETSPETLKSRALMLAEFFKNPPSEETMDTPSEDSEEVTSSPSEDSQASEETIDTPSEDSEGIASSPSEDSQTSEETIDTPSEDSEEVTSSPSEDSQTSEETMDTPSEDSERITSSPSEDFETMDTPSEDSER